MAAEDINKTGEISLGKNIEFKESIVQLELQRDCYDNVTETMRDEKYLLRHNLETKRDGARYYRQRQSRTFPINFAAPIVDTWQDLFMKREPIVPVEVKDLFNGFADNVDGEGNDIVSYLESKMLRDRFVHGNPTTLVDAPNNTALNPSQERAQGIRPFLIDISRIKMVDWSVEKGMSVRCGRYNFMCYQYRAHKPRQSFRDEDVMLWYRRCFFRDLSEGSPKVYSQIFSAKNESSEKWEIESDPLLLEGFDEIPVYTMFTGDWISDICSQVLKYINLESTLDNILYYQGYRHTFVSGNVPPNERGKLSEYSLVLLPENSNVISIPAENPSALLERLASTENNIWRLGLQQIRQVPTNSKVGQSADSQIQEKEGTINLVKRNIGAFENFANQIVKGVAEYHNETAYNPEIHRITFNRDISETDINNTVLVLNTLRKEMSRMPTLRKAVVSQIIRSLNLPEDIQNQVDDEIEKLPEDEFSDTRVGDTFSGIFNDTKNKVSDVGQNGDRNQSPIGDQTN